MARDAAAVRSPVPLLAVLLLGCGARTGLRELGADGDGAPDGSTFDVSVDGATDGVSDEGFDLGPTDAAPVLDLGVPDTGIPASCPGAVPLAGTACAFVGDCSYSGCDPKIPDVAACVGGRWVVTAHACAPAADRCPLAMPGSSTKCSLPEGLVCYWDDCRPASAIGVCRGTWSVKPGNCVPAAAMCPLALPVEGSACPDLGPGTVAACSVRNACGLPATTTCAGGRWHNDVPPCASSPGCPPTEPAPGSPVTPGSPRFCVYANDCGGLDLAQANSTSWLVTRPACPDRKCPTSDGVTGTCSAEGQLCAYPAGAGCELDCTCKGAVWSCVQSCAPAPGGK